MLYFLLFCFMQRTAYELRISDWSSDVCSSDLAAHATFALLRHFRMDDAARGGHPLHAARRQVTDVAEMVLMLHVAIEHVGDSLERSEARSVGTEGVIT